eukprot:scaffold14281_cov102-Isochrysis_galbana.AAC.3
MEHPPADARAAPSASEPNDVVMDIASSPKRPRDPAQDNKVSQSATHYDPALLEIQVSTTECLLREPARACQSLAHHTTLTGRCRKSVDTWAPLSEESQSRSTTTTPAERLGNHGNSATLAQLSINTDKRRRPLRAYQPAIQLPSAQWSKLHPLLHGHTLKTRTEPRRRPRQTPLA